MAKLDAGALRPEVRPIAITPLFEQLRSEFEPIAEKQGLSLRICPSSLAVASDSMMLRRILQNLLANALRYTRAGGVVMGCRRRGDRVCIQVSDTGPGIPRRSRKPYSASSSAARQAPTTRPALGLVSRSSVASRRPSVMRSESRRKWARGSTFFLELPRADPANVVDESHEAQLVDRRYGGLEGAKILLIENDPSGAEAMAALLEGVGGATSRPHGRRRTPCSASAS